jgi:hypothetical protein
LGVIPTSGHVSSKLANSHCASRRRTFDTSRFKISYASVSLVSIADQSASTIASSRASRNAIVSALYTPASRNSSLSSPYRRPEQAVQMANEARAHFVMPVHNQTFRLSSEYFHEPIERFQAALHETPERIALREIGETFVLP